MVKIKFTSLPKWVVHPQGVDIGNGRIINDLTPEETVMILATLPLLRLVGEMARRPNSPAQVDINRVLSTAGIEIDYNEPVVAPAQGWTGGKCTHCDGKGCKRCVGTGNAWGYLTKKG